MTPEQFHAAALAHRGAAFDIKWGADRCYTVGGKMFAVAGLNTDAPAKFAFKASDASFSQLIEEGVAVPAPYMARAKWVQVDADSLPDATLVRYLEIAHGLVAAKLTRKARAELGLG